MSEIRKDPASSTWIILATERGKRPSDFKKQEKKKTEEKKSKKSCPFCATGPEMVKPPEEFAVWPGEIDPKTGKWLTRVLPNKFPALYSDAELTQEQREGLYHSLSGVGGHEIIVDSPKHDDNFGRMSQSQTEAVLRAYRERFRYWRADPRVVYLTVYRNYGIEAGASLAHPHSQLMATPLIPPRVFEELEEARIYYEQSGECVFCQMMKLEKTAKPSRMVFENETMFAFCPFASRFPFETWICSKYHYSSILGIPRKKIGDLAQVIKEVFSRLNKVLGDPPYNLELHVSPLRTPGLLYFHWHFEILPRLTRPAGFEWGSGIYINIISPEDAAKALREAKK